MAPVRIWLPLVLYDGERLSSARLSRRRGCGPSFIERLATDLLRRFRLRHRLDGPSAPRSRGAVPEFCDCLRSGGPVLGWTDSLGHLQEKRAGRPALNETLKGAKPSASVCPYDSACLVRPGSRATRPERRTARLSAVLPALKGEPSGIRRKRRAPNPQPFAPKDQCLAFRDALAIREAKGSPRIPPRSGFGTGGTFLR